MATNLPAGDGHRNGAVRGRSQVLTPRNERWTKRDAANGQFLDQKADDAHFKGVRREHPMDTVDDPARDLDAPFPW